MPPLNSLNSNDIKVWYVRPEDFNDLALLEVFVSWLSAAELDMLKSFRLNKHRHTYLVAHALLRGALSQILNISPSRLQFYKNAFNKPFLVPADEHQDLHFNLTHTDGLAAVCITRLGATGIDVELEHHNIANSEIAPDILTSDEYLDYLHQPASQKLDRLLRYWTLKEAYIKATGLGLSAGLKTYAFDLDFNPQPEIRFMNETRPEMLSQCPSEWRFWQMRLPTEHILAIATHVNTVHHCNISIEQAIWLEDDPARR